MWSSLGVLKNLVFKNSLENLDQELRGRAYGNAVHSGVHVTEDSSKKFSAVYACIRILSETLASMPIILYKERKPGDKSSGKDRAVDHPLYDILKCAAINAKIEMYKVANIDMYNYDRGM